MKYFTREAVFLAVILTVGCGAETEIENAEILTEQGGIAAITNELQVYQGDWESECVLVSDLPDDLQYARLSIRVTGNQLYRSVSNYSDGECTLLSVFPDNIVQMNRYGDLEIQASHTITSLGNADSINIEWQNISYLIGGNLYFGSNHVNGNRPTVLDLAFPLSKRL